MIKRFCEWNPLPRAGFNLMSKSRKFYLSIQKLNDCIFSRRYGYRGKIVLGYSIYLRLWGKEIL